MHSSQVKKHFIRRMVVIAMMVALEVVLSRFLSISTPLLKIGFGFLPIALTAMLYGPMYSGVAWALSDFIGALLFPVAPYFFGFTLSAFLNGFIWGLFIYKNHTKLLRVAAAILISSMLVSLGLDTLWLTIITSNPAAVVLGFRFTRCVIMAPIQFVIISVIGNYFFGFISKNSTLAIKKADLRLEALKYFNGAFLSQREQISNSIADKVAALPEFAAANTVFCYVGRENELNTSVLIEAALAAGKTVAVPLMAGKGVMTARKIASLEELRKGRFGVMEPGEYSELVEPGDIDIAIVPSLLCDAKGRRIGFGGGYYDRFLYKQNITKIVLCPEAMLKKRIINSQFDQRGDIVVC